MAHGESQCTEDFDTKRTPTGVRAIMSDQGMTHFSPGLVGNAAITSSVGGLG